MPPLSKPGKRLSLRSYTGLSIEKHEPGTCPSSTAVPITGQLKRTYREGGGGWIQRNIRETLIRRGDMWRNWKTLNSLTDWMAGWVPPPFLLMPRAELIRHRTWDQLVWSTNHCAKTEKKKLAHMKTAPPRGATARSIITSTLNLNRNNDWEKRKEDSIPSLVQVESRNRRLFGTTIKRHLLNFPFNYLFLVQVKTSNSRFFKENYQKILTPTHFNFIFSVGEIWIQ
jgi:hypothetical protein